MRFLFILSFSFITGFICAQISDSAISTISQNQRWLDELKALPVKQQVDKINKRLLLDIKAADPRLTPNSKAYNGVHPLFVVNGIPVDTNNSKEIKKLTNMLSQAEKINITIMDQKTPAVFCTPQSGVIVIQIRDKRKDE